MKIMIATALEALGKLKPNETFLLKEYKLDGIPQEDGDVYLDIAGGYSLFRVKRHVWFLEEGLVLVEVEISDGAFGERDLQKLLSEDRSWKRISGSDFWEQRRRALIGGSAKHGGWT
jgi:hypothetical protein